MECLEMFQGTSSTSGKKSPVYNVSTHEPKETELEG